MNEQQQRIAIAESMGWTEINSDAYGRVPRGWTSSSYLHPVPDYLNDLNEMHEVEETLNVRPDDPDSPRYAYTRNLYAIVPDDQQPCRATARQRAEAYLRTVGRWVEPTMSENHLDEIVATPENA